MDDWGAARSAAFGGEDRRTECVMRAQFRLPRRIQLRDVQGDPVGFTRALARQLVPDIRVKAVAPGLSCAGRRRRPARTGC
jgi:hypothetical protein